MPPLPPEPEPEPEPEPPPSPPEVDPSVVPIEPPGWLLHAATRIATGRVRIARRGTTMRDGAKVNFQNFKVTISVSIWPHTLPGSVRIASDIVSEPWSGATESSASVKLPCGVAAFPARYKQPPLVSASNTEP